MLASALKTDLELVAATFIEEQNSYQRARPTAVRRHHDVMIL
jgi:hypothetical protein